MIIYIAPSLGNSKQRDIELLEGLSRMKCLSSGAAPGVLEKTDNSLTNMGRATVHQYDGIFDGKFLETTQLVEIGQEHRLDVLSNNLRVDGQFCTVSK
jgi:hypothetical protein